MSQMALEKMLEQRKRRALVDLQQEKNRLLSKAKGTKRKGSLGGAMNDKAAINQSLTGAEEILNAQRDVLRGQGDRLRQNVLFEKQKKLAEGRFYHGIVTYMSRPLERQYFILDSKRATLAVFRSLNQSEANDAISLCQCLMNFETDYSIVNKELSKKFEVQPMDREGLPSGDLL